jgi:hypothetical protein
VAGSLAFLALLAHACGPSRRLESVVENLTHDRQRIRRVATSYRLNEIAMS